MVLNRSQFQHTVVDEHSPSCEGCGEQIQYNAKTAGMQSRQNPETLMNGWYHQDGMKRDHQATPSFGVSGEDELTRSNAKRDQARMTVRKTLNDQMLGMSVDKIFEG